MGAFAEATAPRKAVDKYAEVVSALQALGDGSDVEFETIIKNGGASSEKIVEAIERLTGIKVGRETVRRWRSKSH